MALLRRLILLFGWACGAAAQAAVGLLQLPGSGDDGPITVFYPSRDGEAPVQRGPFALRAAWRKERGLPFSQEASVAKLYASECAWRTCNRVSDAVGCRPTSSSLTWTPSACSSSSARPLRRPTGSRTRRSS